MFGRLSCGNGINHRRTHGQQVQRIYCPVIYRPLSCLLSFSHTSWTFNLPVRLFHTGVSWHTEVLNGHFPNQDSIYKKQTYCNLPKRWNRLQQASKDLSPTSQQYEEKGKYDHIGFWIRPQKRPIRGKERGMRGKQHLTCVFRWIHCWWKAGPKGPIQETLKGSPTRTVSALALTSTSKSLNSVDPAAGTATERLSAPTSHRNRDGDGLIAVTTFIMA